MGRQKYAFSTSGKIENEISGAPGGAGLPLRRGVKEFAEIFLFIS
jgi:hypothetical protein